MHVGDEDEQPGKCLAGLGDTEFGGLLDGVDGVATGVGQPDHVCARGLGLQQERGEIGAGEGVTDGADHRATGFLNHLGGIGFERMAEGVVGGQEIPVLVTGFDHGAAGAVGQGIGVIGPVSGARCALCAGQVG